MPNYVSKPMVAGISGYAVAGGLELALLCDLRVVEDTAIMGLLGRRFGMLICIFTLKNSLTYFLFNICCNIFQNLCCGNTDI